MISLTKRLRKVMEEGNLTIADLSRWLDRPSPTVRSWTRGTTTRGAAGDIETVLTRLKLIEKRIRLRKGLPVPRFRSEGRMSAPRLRIAYLNKLMARKRI